MSRVTPSLIALAFVLALGGCATETPYQPMGASAGETIGGYGETQIEPGHWRVSFSGNNLTSRTTVETYMLYRSAELTLAQGYDWFRIVEHQTGAQTQLQTYQRPSMGPAVSLWGPHWRYREHSWFGGWRDWDPGVSTPSFEVRSVSAFVASAEIVMGRGAKPADDPAVFEARAILQKLGPEVARPN